MTGKNNSIASRFVERNESVFIAGCPCHLVHIAASNSHEAFSEYIGINVEDVMLTFFIGLIRVPKERENLNNILNFVIKSIKEF